MPTFMILHVEESTILDDNEEIALEVALAVVIWTAEISFSPVRQTDV